MLCQLKEHENRFVNSISICVVIVAWSELLWPLFRASPRRANRMYAIGGVAVLNAGVSGVGSSSDRSLDSLTSRSRPANPAG